MAARRASPPSSSRTWPDWSTDQTRLPSYPWAPLAGPNVKRSRVRPWTRSSNAAVVPVRPEVARLASVWRVVTRSQAGPPEDCLALARTDSAVDAATAGVEAWAQKRRRTGRLVRMKPPGAGASCGGTLRREIHCILNERASIAPRASFARGGYPIGSADALVIGCVPSTMKLYAEARG